MEIGSPVGACEAMTDRLSLHDVCLARHEIVTIAHIVNANSVICEAD